MAVIRVERHEEGRRASGVTNPPEGGWGWIVVAGCFLATICIRAVTRCISMFFVEFQTHFEQDSSSTAWIHSMIDSTTMLCAPLGSFLGNRLSCRATVFLGGILSSVGLVLSSFASSLEFLYASLGVLTGLGFALSYTPAIAMVGRYFSERKALAYGIALSGSGIGTFLLAPAVQLFIDHYSWRGALLILGGFVSNLCICGAPMRPPEQNRAERIWGNNMTNVEKGCMTAVLQTELPEKIPTDWGQAEPKQQQMQNLKDKHGLVISIGTFKNLGLDNDKIQESITLLPSPKLTVTRVTDKKMAECVLLSNKLETMLEETGVSGVKHQHAAFLMSIFGVSGIVGNITFGWITDRKCLKGYRMLSYMVAISMEGFCCMFLPFLHSFSLLVMFSILYGYFDGAYVALIPVVTSDTVGSAHLTSALGVVYFLHAIPYLVSPPIGGWFVDQTGNYASTFFVCGASFFLSSLVLVAASLATHLMALCERALGQNKRPKGN
ncbi:monocarboxylate transporter 12-B-like isoform X4 [Girardinichthys multiradiatus]|uniref:monocarboxylate transporter 12-B-like isoform X4 n=1 Tax=Girardinichthys multiradiatus TaxID=208333 RepID=UPI001FAC0547|nr:monocarboxylate transporter 12-B-like isoform X4 [Girardinichthys multiradiatus]